MVDQPIHHYQRTKGDSLEITKPPLIGWRLNPNTPTCVSEGDNQEIVNNPEREVHPKEGQVPEGKNNQGDMS